MGRFHRDCFLQFLSYIALCPIQFHLVITSWVFAEITGLSCEHSAVCGSAAVLWAPALAMSPDRRWRAKIYSRRVTQLSSSHPCCHNLPLSYQKETSACISQRCNSSRWSITATGWLELRKDLARSWTKVPGSQSLLPWALALIMIAV